MNQQLKDKLVHSLLKAGKKNKNFKAFEEKEKVKRQERNLRRQTGSLQYSGCFCLVWLIIYP